ncbi:MAG: hypothetical protein ACKO5K_05605 [Armatimonadota bacterium]
MADSIRLLVSLRRYHPAGDPRLSHWQIVECDLLGRIRAQWTRGDADHFAMEHDPARNRVYCVRTSRRDRVRPVEVVRIDSPGAPPRVLARFEDGLTPYDLALSPDGRMVSVRTWAPRESCRILDTATGKQLASAPGTSEFEWIGPGAYRVEGESGSARFGRIGPGPRPTPPLPEKPTVSLETEYPDEDGVGVLYCIAADGTRTRVEGDPLWNRCLRENLIQGVDLLDRRPDGTWWVATYPHRASLQVVGILDPARAQVRFAFRAPGTHLRLEGTPWVVGWPLQRFTELGELTIEERPLYRLDRRRPGHWRRMWPGAHHVDSLIRIA